MTFKNAILVLITGTIFITCQDKTNEINDNVVYAEAGDRELELATQEALSNLDYFIESFQSNSNDTNFVFSLKMDFIDGVEHEHMWVTVNKYEDDKFEGVLNNEPEIVKTVKFGQQITVTKNQIEDWLILNNKTGEMEGGYSVAVLSNR